MNKHVALYAAALVALFSAGIAQGACDVPGIVRIDPFGDAHLTVVTGLPEYIGVTDRETAVTVPLETLRALDVEKLQSCYDSAADKFEYRLTVHNAHTLPSWSQWAVMANSFYKTIAFAEAVTGPLGAVSYRLMRVTSYGPGVLPRAQCLGSIQGHMEGNTFVLRVSRQALAEAVYNDDTSAALDSPYFFTGIQAAPDATRRDCDLPDLRADN
jgi:hypothetical protein